MTTMTAVPGVDHHPTPADALAHFSRRLAFETDVSDVHAALHGGGGGFVLIDTRDQSAWDQGHVPGAVHLPRHETAARGSEVIPAGSSVVVYCWGPGCNGAVKAALALATLGYAAMEMLGGYEYWVREGFPVETTDGLRENPPDPLTAPAGRITCDC